jgi:hypothetical protein
MGAGRRVQAQGGSAGGRQRLGAAGHGWGAHHIELVEGVEGRVHADVACAERAGRDAGRRGGAANNSVVTAARQAKGKHAAPRQPTARA